MNTVITFELSYEAVAIVLMGLNTATTLNKKHFDDVEKVRNELISNVRYGDASEVMKAMDERIAHYSGSSEYNNFKRELSPFRFRKE